jgi:hypothetical protein
MDLKIDSDEVNGIRICIISRMDLIDICRSFSKYL